LTIARLATCTTNGCLRLQLPVHFESGECRLNELEGDWSVFAASHGNRPREPQQDVLYDCHPVINLQPTQMNMYRNTDCCHGNMSLFVCPTLTSRNIDGLKLSSLAFLNLYSLAIIVPPLILADVKLDLGTLTYLKNCKPDLSNCEGRELTK
jgi:hypothetical protein